MIEFHKIWIEQCDAAECIKERFGTKDATRYLIGEKLLRFMEASLERPEFAEELPQFAAAIRRLIEPHQIVEFFEDLEAGKVPDPAKLMNGREFDDEELDESEVLHEADRILMVENAKRLLLT